MSRRRFSSNTVRVVGALIPSDVLAKAMEREGLEGLEPQDFGLPENTRLRDAVNYAWNEAKALWWRFRSDLEQLPPDDVTATSLTRERWLLPLLGLLGFEDVDVVPEAIDIGGTKYPISHMWHSTPLHLMGAKVGLDGRISGIRGAARLSPHSLLQQFLNRSDDHLWGIVSNGLKLRILRDSVSLTRQAFVEFDLEAMLNGEVFPDFILLFLVAHATRFAGDRRDDCLLERWIAAARDEGIRALDQLRSGVEAALTTLGTGLLSHPENRTLRNVVDAGDVDAKALYRYLLRLVYRLLFLFVAEDRDLLLLPDASPEIRERYRRFYSTGRFRNLASRPTTPGNTDLWEGLVALMQVLGRDEGEPRLGLPGLGSFLWAQDSIGPLVDADLGNEEFLTAIRGLAYVEEDGTLRRIDFVDLGAEELGSVYESLLELHPSIKDRSFVLGAGAGSERKTTGSYYTPTELISELLDSALDPVLGRAVSEDDPEQAILNLKVVDPAVGSGHFLVAAAHRIGKRLAEVRTGEPEPPEDAYRTAIRDVVSRCLYAVDLNDLAVELCKVSLWLEALEPGKPLSFLDHHILVGNSLFGATPSAIADGIPNDVFVALTGDDRKIVSELKRRNRRERAGQEGLAFDAGETVTLGSEIEALEEFIDTDLETVRTKERMLADWRASPAYEHARLVADAWCTAFAIEKRPGVAALTESGFRRLRDEGIVDSNLSSEVKQLREQFGFFHWHLAFPQVFRMADTDDPTLWEGGFDAVLGNPPWEKVEFAEKEYFAALEPKLSVLRSSARKAAIVELQRTRPSLWSDYRAAVRDTEVLRHFLARSRRYPLCGRGRINTYAVFSELATQVISPNGRAGVVLPTGIATDETTRLFFADLIDRRSLVSLFSFYDRKQIFRSADVHAFCLLTVSGEAVRTERPEFVFFAKTMAEMKDQDRRFRLTRDDIRLINPNTQNCPIFRSRTDADLVRSIYQRVPILVSKRRGAANPWGIRFSQGDLNMAADSSLFRTREALEKRGLELEGNVFHSLNGRYIPLYEAKMIHQFNHRWASYTYSDVERLDHDTQADQYSLAVPRYWVSEIELPSDHPAVASDWRIGFRDIARSTDERTVIASVLPAALFGHHISLVESTHGELAAMLVANLNSFALDYVARQKIAGTHVSFFIAEQLPLHPPEIYRDPAPWCLSRSLGGWFLDRIVELSATSVDLVRFAGHDGGPFRWDSARRSALRAEIDAAYLHLYEVSRSEADHILDSFPVVRQRDTARFGSYRTKELILEVYDHMKKAIEIGEPYQTILDPPPADPSLRVDVEASS